MKKRLAMSRIFSRTLLVSLGLLLAVSAMRPGWTQSVDASYRSTPLGLYPPNIGFGASGPMMMLTASKDHTLFSPIYTDYEDIDGDGTVDYTFKSAFRYYGYFDAEKCYGYNAAHSTGGRFEPRALATTAGDGRLVCPSTQSLWSGNFLNWATMTRLDVVRKTLYGGRRVQDTLADTTLEMAALAHDAHAFVKYYGGSDIRDYTPFTHAELGRAGLTLCSRGTAADGQGSPQLRVAKGNYSLWATTPGTVCNWSENQPNFAFGQKAQAFYRQYGPPASLNPDAAQQVHRPNLPSRATDGGVYGGIGPELAIRVQACSADYVGQGSERCRTYRRTVSNVEQVSHKPIGLLQEFGTSELTRQPVRAEFGLITGSYDDNFRGGQLRKNIGSVNDEVDLGTGRFCHLLTASDSNSNCTVTAASFSGGQGASVPGIIRSFDRVRLYQAGDYNAGGPEVSFPLPREVSNGQFPSWGNPMSEMITQALAYFANLPMGGSVSTTGGRDAQVGLQVSVVARDPLQDSDNDPVAGISRKALYGRAICRPMHMLAISSGAVTHDTDEPGASEDVYGTATEFMSKNVAAADQAKATIQAATDSIGEHEGINGQSRSVGSVNAGFGVDCTSKTIGTVVSGGLSKVAGVCPEAPAVKGTYLGAGAAFIANTKAIRAPGELNENNGRSVATSRLPAHALRVRSYAATLSGGVARIEVPIPGKSGVVYITPESSWDFEGFNGKNTGGDLMPGAMLTFRSIYGDANSASYVVTWNDAQFGGDYDMDIVGFLRWERTESSTKPGTYELKVMTDILNHDASARGAHGFSIIGTDKALGLDRRYLTHGGENFAVGGADSDCNNLTVNSQAFNLQCAYTDGGMKTSNGGGSDGFAWPTQYNGTRVDFFQNAVGGVLTSTVAKTFTITDGATDVTLRDPLWYIAKYGSFNTGESKFALSSTAVPDAPVAGTATNWDQQNNSNPNCTGASCADGEPDGYFLARRPELLETRLRQLLGNIVANSNAAPAVSATQLLVDEFKFQAEFSRDQFSGTVKAFKLNSAGSFLQEWDAGLRMELGGNRTVISNMGQTGVTVSSAFLGSTEGLPYLNALLGLSAAQQASTTQVEQAQSLAVYMNGARTDEGVRFRVRGVKGLGNMGPVVSSTPWVQDRRFAARYSDGIFPSTAPSYRAYVSTKAASESLVWVGSNDGMLHGMKVSDGNPVLSYVPGPLVSRLSAALSASNTENIALMDGSPFTGDVLVPSASSTGDSQVWKTYLFSSLGRGGQALFALDVTPAANLSTTAAASTFKWGFTASDDAWSNGTVSEKSDLGYNVQDPIKHNVSGQAAPIVYLNDGHFWLMHANGHKSDSGRAVLFLFKMTGPGGAPWRNASTGAPNGYLKLPTRATDQDNGLMGITWVDLDNNDTADLAYGTDLKGQVWRFDLRDTNPANWRVGLYDPAVAGAQNLKEGIPLFTATDAEGRVLPITSAPAATFPSYGGIMLSFGTGRALEAGDFPDVARTQRFITVWDRGGYAGDRTFAAPKVLDAATNKMVDRHNVLPALNRTVQNKAGIEVQTFIQRFAFRDESGNVYLAQTDDAGQVRLDAQGKPVPLGAMDVALRFDPSIHDGWFFAFPDGGSQGEAVISSPGIRSNYVFFTSVRGQTAQEQEQSCAQVPLATLYALSPVNGLPVNNLLVQGSYYLGVPASDQKLVYVRDRSQEVAGSDPSCTGPDCNPCSLTCGTGTVRFRAMGASTDQCMCVPATSLRIQWRELPGLRTQ